MGPYDTEKLLGTVFQITHLDPVTFLRTDAVVTVQEVTPDYIAVWDHAQRGTGIRIARGLFERAYAAGNIFELPEVAPYQTDFHPALLETRR